MQQFRHYHFFDRVCLGVDQALRALTNNAKGTGAAYPAKSLLHAALNDHDRRHAAGLMRVNHAGEICAQALYHGQGLVSKSVQMQESMQQAAIEEGDHLAWCSQRLTELHSHTSYLNPLWYVGSFVIGMAAGMIGDKWSLGFVAETESQVIKHLASHSDLLPTTDLRSAKILAQMQKDETVHRDQALQEGAKELPGFVKEMMACVSKIMVKTAYWL